MDKRESREHFTALALHNAKNRNRNSKWLYWTDAKGKEFYVKACPMGEVEYLDAK